MDLKVIIRSKFTIKCPEMEKWQLFREIEINKELKWPIGINLKQISVALKRWLLLSLTTLRFFDIWLPK